ncbi:hypothetical protein NM208_g2011 [Fusarium decemcellulare]|uniref:Uncharacterized protein n=1 Tax=Fusarium decemcellulare TaxID=57161 RepID=A0ACC1SU67_9HYPO|nr:hypothetical protein NM208_g2011 [Fusarium decemcellulare]
MIALLEVARCIKLFGPFDGAIGFSQGGTVLSLASALLDPTRKPGEEISRYFNLFWDPELNTRIQPPFKFLASFCSPDAPGDGLRQFWDPKVAIPMLQVAGELDTHTDETEDERDAYGRLITAGAMSATISLPKDDFTLTLPEDPYHVRKTTAYQKGTSFREFPDQIFLQFPTWKTSFHIVPVMDNTADSSDSGDIVGAGLRRCHIMDRCRDKCGSVVIDTE